MDFVLSWEVLLLLFALAMLAGFVDTLAGGGGLITVPVLLLSGLPPIHALATNKIQSAFRDHGGDWQYAAQSFNPV